LQQDLHRHLDRPANGVQSGSRKLPMRILHLLPLLTIEALDSTGIDQRHQHVVYLGNCER
jgi:hypothetical protein